MKVDFKIRKKIFKQFIELCLVGYLLGGMKTIICKRKKIFLRGPVNLSYILVGHIVPRGLGLQGPKTPGAWDPQGSGPLGPGTPGSRTLGACDVQGLGQHSC